MYEIQLIQSLYSTVTFCLKLMFSNLVFLTVALTRRVVAFLKNLLKVVRLKKFENLSICTTVETIVVQYTILSFCRI